jgi:hypothetical protein
VPGFAGTHSDVANFAVRLALGYSTVDGRLALQALALVERAITNRSRLAVAAVDKRIKGK